MEFPFRNAIVSTLVHATEDEQRVFSALRTLMPDEIEIHRSKLKGHHGNPIVSFEARIGRKRFLHELWQRIISKLRAGELEKLAQVAPDRIDDTCHLYLRFDKQLAYAGGLMLTESGDAVHVTLKVVAYPAKRETAVMLVKKFMQG